MNNYLVYKHTNKVNGKVYIGITSTSANKRWQSGRGYRNSPHFRNAIIKYGWDGFDHEILFSELSKEEACEKEKELIAEYDSVNNGYNLSSGGEAGAAGVIQSEETRLKRKNSVTKAWSSETLRLEQSRRLKGKRKSDEARVNMSKAAKGRVIDDVQKDKIASTLREYFSDPDNRKKLSDNVEKYAVVCEETGEVYSSSHEAYRATGIQQGNINACCRGKRNKAGGYHWKFYDSHANTEITTEIKESVAS